MPTGHYADVIERLKPGAAAAGDIVDLDGRVLGRHDGIIHFTVGQRRGLGDRRPARRSTWCGSMPSARRVVVGPREALRMQPHRAARRQLDRRRRARCSARRRPPRGVRQGALDAAAAGRRGCARGDGGYEVELVDGEDGVSPGQACVFYDARARARRACSAAASSRAPRRPSACARPKRAARQPSRG